MSITRVFRVQIHAELRSDFEPKFQTLSQDLVKRAHGCIYHVILKPTKWTPDEYAMISEWESEDDLIAFAGENWSESVIPPEMEQFAKNHSVSHYDSWET